MDLSSLTPIAMFALFVGFMYWARKTDKANEAKRAAMSKESEADRLSDEGIAKVQHRFERRLANDLDLPDGICWGDAYVYWHLMRKWYATLAARHRYDGTLEQVKKDWLTYLDLKRSYATSRFLYFDGNPEKRGDYEKVAYEESLQITAIEDAFAQAVGPEAVAELAAFRMADNSAFDKTGKEKMAPPGFRYEMVSVNPYTEELVRDE